MKPTRTTEEAAEAARRLHAFEKAKDPEAKLATAYQKLAIVDGHPNWNTMKAGLGPDAGPGKTQAAMPRGHADQDILSMADPKGETEAQNTEPPHDDRRRHGNERERLSRLRQEEAVLAVRRRENTLFAGRAGSGKTRNVVHPALWKWETPERRSHGCLLVVSEGDAPCLDDLHLVSSTARPGKRHLQLSRDMPRPMQPTREDRDRHHWSLTAADLVNGKVPRTPLEMQEWRGWREWIERAPSRAENSAAVILARNPLFREKVPGENDHVLDAVIARSLRTLEHYETAIRCGALGDVGTVTRPPHCQVIVEPHTEVTTLLLDTALADMLEARAHGLVVLDSLPPKVLAESRMIEETLREGRRTSLTVLATCRSLGHVPERIRQGFANVTEDA